MIELDEKDLLQANATVIAGVLILLSLLGSVVDVLQLYSRILTGVAIVPFIISSVALLIREKDKKPVSPERRFVFARKITVAGFLYLMVAVIALLTGLQSSA